jgi:unsaturated rhamnogalacturonyl hydrolase
MARGGSKYWICLGHIILSSLLLLSTSGCSGSETAAGNRAGSAERLALLVAHRVIKDTGFELRDFTQKPVAGIQVIDFPAALPGFTEVMEASSLIGVDTGGALAFGVSATEPFSISVNGARTFTQSTIRPFHFQEVAYGIFEFQDSIKLPLKAGINRIAVTSTRGRPGEVYLRELSAPEEKQKGSFVSPDSGRGAMLWPWLYATSDGRKSVITPGPVKELVIPPSSAYKREAYAEWHYAHGSLIFTMQELGETLNDPALVDFVKRYCDFTLATMPLFRAQYEDRHHLRTSNYRIFRKGMLDDAGAPTLPFIEALLQRRDTAYAKIVRDMVAYVSHGQCRRSDGVFCRPEPEPNSVWADDLFMSVPLLLRMTQWTGDSSYADDAARQIVGFDKYLRDTVRSVYRHCYLGTRRQQSAALWGRANGWVVWAITEALHILPREHPLRSQIIANFRRHMDGLAAFQDSSGMWHQLLDDGSTFEETSCTAMFVIGMARGLRNGWLDRRFEKPLARAWDALVKRIDAQGVVKEITSGTSVSDDLGYYRARPRYSNDPRGLGAVITACREMILFDDTKLSPEHMR